MPGNGRARALYSVRTSAKRFAAARATLQDNERWRLDGRDFDGDDLTLIVVFEAGVVVVTVF